MGLTAVMVVTVLMVPTAATGLTVVTVLTVPMEATVVTALIAVTAAIQVVVAQQAQQVMVVTNINRISVFIQIHTSCCNCISRNLLRC
jgi:hypothetical protein